MNDSWYRWTAFKTYPWCWWWLYIFHAVDDGDHFDIHDFDDVHLKHTLDLYSFTVHEIRCFQVKCCHPCRIDPIRSSIRHNRCRGYRQSESFSILTYIHSVAVDNEIRHPSISQAFGIDDGRLIIAALLPSLIIFPLYNKWSSDQEGDDFFDGYEKRRNG